MSITIDGTANTISGLTAGGLPTGSVTSDTIANATSTGADLNGAQTGSAPVYGCRAWCVFNGTTTGTNAPTAGGNVSTVTRNSTGNYTVNFTTAMPDNNYATVASDNIGFGAVVISSPSTTSVVLQTTNTGGTLTDAALVSVAIFR